MSNSKLVDYTKISPNSSNPRNHKIDTITIHHTAGVVSVETLGSIFEKTSRQASSNYGIGSDGRVGLYVDEANRSWCSSNRDNDNRAITIEVANSENGDPWRVSDKVLAKLIDLCVDICQRNGIEQLNYTGDKTGNLTMHKWFAATGCPGEYLGGKFPYIAAEVNKRLNATTQTENTSVVYCVQVGAYKTKKAAQARLAKVKAAGFEDAFIAEKPSDTTAATPAAPATKTIDELAREVIAGKWASGAMRKEKLTAAGYDYAAVQKRVNEIMKG